MSDLSLPEGLTSRVLTDDDAQAVYDVAAAQEQADIGKVEIELADIVSDWSRPELGRRHPHDRRLRRRPDGRRTARSPATTAATRPSTPTTAAAASARRSPAGCSRPCRTSAAPGTAARCPRARPATGSSRSSATASAGPAGCSTCPRAPRSRTAPCPRATRSARPSPRSTPRSTTSSRTRSSSGRCATASPYDDFEASVIGRPGFEPWNLRVVTDAGGEIVGAALVIMCRRPGDGGVHRPARRTPRPAAPRVWPRRCSSTRSPEVASTGATRPALSTDSRTGALGLYQKVGMEVGDVWVNRAIGV